MKRVAAVVAGAILVVAAALFYWSPEQRVERRARMLEHILRRTNECASPNECEAWLTIMESEGLL